MPPDPSRRWRGSFRSSGSKAVIVNPTPWPPLFAFLKDGLDDQTARGAEALRSAGALVSLDVSDVRRLGSLATAAKSLPGPRVVIDHHVPTDEPAGDIVLADTAACATGELLYDLAIVLGLEIDLAVAEALYVAILTDTGGFRYSNTSPRSHVVAAELISRGVDPELHVPAHLRVAVARPAPAAARRARHVRRGRQVRPGVGVGDATRRWTGTASAPTTSTASSSIRDRSPARAWRCSSATWATAR